MEHRVDAALADASRALGAAGSPTPRLDAEVLLAHVLGRDRTWLLSHPEAVVREADAYRRLVERRAAGEPVAYLRGFKEWRSLRLRTDARALSPRPETELLVDIAGDEIRIRLGGARRVIAWDVGTGSGAVAIALAVDFEDAVRAGRLRILASDASGGALELAGENLAAHGLAGLVDLVRGDLLEAPPAPDGLLPDVIVANLPYVPSAAIVDAGPFLAHEPRLALDGGPDGLGVIRRLLGDVRDRTAPGATVVLEIGIGQAEAVRELAPSGSSVSTVDDLAGIARFVVIRLAD